MKTHEFVRTVNVGPRKFEAGDQIARGDILDGNFDSCVRIGHLVEIPPAKPAVAAVIEPAGDDDGPDDEIKPKGKGKKKGKKAKAGDDEPSEETEATDPAGDDDGPDEQRDLIDE